MTGIGDGVLSEQARARLSRPSSSMPEPMPDLTDHGAVSAWRQRCNAEWGEQDLVGGVRHRRVEIGGVSCLEAGDRDRPTVMYLHGGGYVLGSAGVAIPITSTLAEQLHVVSVDYALPPPGIAGGSERTHHSVGLRHPPPNCCEFCTAQVENSQQFRVNPGSSLRR